MADLGRSQTPHERTLARLGMVSTPAVAEADTPHLQGQASEQTQGRERDTDDSLIRALIHIPAALATLEQMVSRVLHTMQSALAPQAWANAADVSNTAANTAFGAESALPLFMNYTQGGGARLRNVFVGTSVPAVVQLAAAKLSAPGDMISRAANTPRVLGTLRTTANSLSAVFPGELLLKQGEALIAIIPAGGAISLDFSCDYRLLPQG